MANQFAGPGEVFVCTACGKRSKDKHGNQAIDHGWDTGCVMNSELVKESQLVIESGRVTSINLASAEAG